MIFFNTIIKRVANFSIQSYEAHKNNLSDFFEKNELFNLCILTASGSLHSDLNKNKSEKTEGSLINYFNRAHFNPTPFSVFNSVGTLQWGNNTDIYKPEKLLLMVKYDNLFVSSKIDENSIHNWQDLSYCTNPSICYLNDNKISFYKSKNQNNDKIEISYAEIDVDEDLTWLLSQFKDGKKIDLVLTDLILQGFKREEVEDFLQETIETGIIIETFLLDSYTNKLYNSYAPYLSGLIEKKKHFLKTKSDIKNFSNEYLNEQNSFFEKNNKPKNFYAINCFDDETGTLDSCVQDKIKKFIDFTVHYNSQTQAVNDILEQFINKIKEKFNEGFIPFNTIFNPYSGIKYSDLKTEKELKLHQDIVMKILESTEKNVFLNLPCVDNLEIKANKLPLTFTVVLENLTCKITSESVVYMRNLGYASALSMISRFSEIGQDAYDEIINYEKRTNEDKIISDINCVGTFRSINLAPVKQCYDYCLPINTAYNEASNPILLSDIYAHLNSNSFSLVSKTHKKQVLPKKVSAINPKILESDIYNFLCDFEVYNQEIYAVNFNLNLYYLPLIFVPRIYLEKGILLYPAQILLVYKNQNISEFYDYLQEKVKQYSFSQKIVIINSQTDTIIDIKKKEDISSLYEKIKENKKIYVSEFLYDFFDPEIKRGNENFAHELVVSVKNPHYKRQNIDYSNTAISSFESQNIPIVSDWLYLELFCNTYADSEIFNVIYNKIILENKTELFFFVNYSNPERHLRLRFKTKSVDYKQQIISVVHELKLKNIINKYHILSYEQETQRYGGIEMMNLGETIFDKDSRDFLTNIFNKGLEENDLKIVAVLKIKYYLYFFNLSLDQAISYCENCTLNYSKEFELTSHLRKDLNKEYADIKIDITKYSYENFLYDDSFKISYHNQLKISETDLYSNVWLIIHMSMNRHFSENQRFNEFKTYYLTKCYLNQLKFTKK